jgi:hypothetical protein
MYAQTVGTWSLAEKSCMVVPNNLGMITAVSP